MSHRRIGLPKGVEPAKHDWKVVLDPNEIKELKKMWKLNLPALDSVHDYRNSDTCFFKNSLLINLMRTSKITNKEMSYLVTAILFFKKINIITMKLSLLKNIKWMSKVICFVEDNFVDCYEKETDLKIHIITVLDIFPYQTLTLWLLMTKNKTFFNLFTNSWVANFNLDDELQELHLKYEKAKWKLITREMTLTQFPMKTWIKRSINQFQVDNSSGCIDEIVIKGMLSTLGALDDDSKMIDTMIEETFKSHYLKPSELLRIAKMNTIQEENSKMLSLLEARENMKEEEKKKNEFKVPSISPVLDKKELIDQTNKNELISNEEIPLTRIRIEEQEGYEDEDGKISVTFKKNEKNSTSSSSLSQVEIIDLPKLSSMSVSSSTRALWSFDNEMSLDDILSKSVIR
jgi:hypothetical protein